MQKQVDYNIAIERKYPEQVAMVIVKDEQGKYNPMPLGWTMLTSYDPPMMAISLGKQRHTASLLDKSNEFVLVYPSEGMEEQIWALGTSSGKNGNKMENVEVRTEKACKIDSLLFTDAVANFECRLVSRQETGDHILYIGEVVCSHMHENEDIKRVYTMGQKLQAL